MEGHRIPGPQQVLSWAVMMDWSFFRYINHVDFLGANKNAPNDLSSFDFRSISACSNFTLDWVEWRNALWFDTGEPPFLGGLMVCTMGLGKHGSRSKLNRKHPRIGKKTTGCQTFSMHWSLRVVTLKYPKGIQGNLPYLNKFSRATC